MGLIILKIFVIPIVCICIITGVLVGGVIGVLTLIGYGSTALGSLVGGGAITGVLLTIALVIVLGILAAIIGKIFLD